MEKNLKLRFGFFEMLAVINAYLIKTDSNQAYQRDKRRENNSIYIYILLFRIHKWQKHHHAYEF